MKQGDAAFEEKGKSFLYGLSRNSLMFFLFILFSKANVFSSILNPFIMLVNKKRWPCRCNKAYDKECPCRNEKTYDKGNEIL